MKQPTDLSKRNDALYEAWLCADYLASGLELAGGGKNDPDDLRRAWQALQAKMEAVLP